MASSREKTENAKPPAGDFLLSRSWHLKTLAIIYGFLGIGYILLKLFIR